MNIYRKLAAAVNVFHWIWIAVLLLGFPAQFFFHWYKPFNWFVVMTTAVFQILWCGCPLVVLENELRAKYDPDVKAHRKSFITYYLKKRFNVNVSPIVITVLLIAMVVASGVLLFK